VTVDDETWLAERFETQRARLNAVAYRMLGSQPEAEDAVQEAWVRLSRSDTSEVDNLAGWLTTVTARVCLDMLRSRASRREAPLGDGAVEAGVGIGAGADPQDEAVLADSVGLALLVVLDTLSPPERLAFVLHDLFAVPFEAIAPIVGRTPAAARQLASRGGRRVRGASAGRELDPARQREVVGAFLAASREGDFASLVELLDPDVVLRADGAAVRAGAEPEVRGAHSVAATFSGRARAARLALVDGVVGAVWAHGGRPRVVFGFTVAHGKVVGINLVADPERLSRLHIAALDR
jgi:RNA polymerase sigma-70 factor (ECF subfamily)